MHELSFAEQILKVVDGVAHENGGRKVTRVTLKVGKMSGVDKRSLSFCLDAISSGTVMAGARIEIIDVEPELVCEACGRFPVAGATAPVCPKCNRPAELSPGMDLYVEEIELNDDEEDPASKKD
jgi:hydrogenase nickel incorporation protein HypA/HybF